MFKISLFLFLFFICTILLSIWCHWFTLFCHILWIWKSKLLQSACNILFSKRQRTVLTLYQGIYSYKSKGLFNYTSYDTWGTIIVTRSSYYEKKQADSPLVRLWRRQRNGRWLWTTGSERRTSFTTVDNTGSETTDGLLGWQQLWFAHILYFKSDYFQGGAWEDLSEATESAMPNNW